MSHVIQCDGCKAVISAGELQWVAADATIKDNPERLHICKDCAKHIVRFIGDFNEFGSGIVDPEHAYIQGYLDSVREHKRDGDGAV